jgi:uncharacterized membrane protein YeiH
LSQRESFGLEFQPEAGQLSAERKLVKGQYMILLDFFDLVGTIAFALSGGMMAVRKNMDLFGIILLSIVTAIGGGIIRDVLLGITPPFCFTDSKYFLIGIVSGLIVFLVYTGLEKFINVIIAFDAIGLSAFAVIGTVKAYPLVGPIGAVVLGTMSGIAGGIIRDTISMEIPFVLRKEVYAFACILGCSLYCVLVKLNIAEDLSMLISIFIIIAVRLIAVKYQLNLPKKPI